LFGWGLVSGFSRDFGDGNNELGEREDGLHSDVHDHHALSAEMEGQDLEGVGNQETGPANVVEAAKEPDEDELRVAGAGVQQVGVLVHGAGDGPADEADDHAFDGY
jgi:hypothetical protein